MIIKESLERVLTAHDLTHVQAHLLGELRAEDGQVATKLASRILVKPSNFTTLARSLESVGYIERKQDTKDKRVYKFYLTDAGKTVTETIDKDFAKMFAPQAKESETLQEAVLAGFEAFHDLVKMNEQAKTSNPPI